VSGDNFYFISSTLLQQPSAKQSTKALEMQNIDIGRAYVFNQPYREVFNDWQINNWIPVNVDSPNKFFS
jgi:hypothetical protein